MQFGLHEYTCLMLFQSLYWHFQKKKKDKGEKSGAYITSALAHCTIFHIQKKKHQF